MKAKYIIESMEKWAKPDFIDNWDNTGFQIGNKDKIINKILIALDLDRIVLNKAIEDNYDMIITHHPLIFKPLKSITSNNYGDKLIIDIIKNDIVVYSAHSNLDLAENGVNDILASILNITSTKPLTEEGNGIGYGRIGSIEEISVLDFINFTKEKLEAKDLIVYGDINKKVTRVAVCGGSGSDFISDVHRLGGEVYVTGDIKYHDAQLAVQLGITLIDAGHFNTEKIILPIIKEYLIKTLDEKTLITVITESNLDYKIY